MEIVEQLPDTIDYMSGKYTGKDLTTLPLLLDLYKVTDKLTMYKLVNRIIKESTRITNEKLNNNRASTNGN